VPNIAIIGCGLIGETHARALRSLGARVAAVCDQNETRVAALAEEFNCIGDVNPSNIIHLPQIDAVYICTYHDTHASLAIEAANAKKAIFLEKPMAINALDCDAIVSAVRENEVLCMSGFKLHYYSLVRRAKEMIGSPLALAAHVLDRRWPNEIWANDPIMGGGNVLSQGCHAVDLLNYFAASKPVRIYAEGGNLHHNGIDVIDTMSATITYESGAVASLLVGDIGETPYNGKFSVQAMDGSRSIHLHHRLTQLTYFDGKNTETIVGEEDGFLNENQEFLSALEAYRQPETNEIDGARATKMLLAGIESIRTHKPQSLEDIP
jgi:myo-inositol 2-dehydrogenase/D-chiro-inositol 1-dehydrogenase